MDNPNPSAMEQKQADLAALPTTAATANYVVPDSTRAWYVLGMLTLTFAIAYIDRQLLNLIIDPIKRDLVISDTQISLIQGAAFIAAYVLASPVFGRLVDVANRRNVLIGGICLWCFFTVLSGAVSNYEELFLARFGVGASEACMMPAGWSILADYFSVERRPRALSVFMVGPLIGAGTSLVAGGAVIGYAGELRHLIPVFSGLSTWQLAFVLVGVPGFVVAALLLTVREPTRTSELAGAQEDRRYTVREVVAFLKAKRGFYLRIYIGIGMIGIVYLGLPAWFPSFLVRVHGVPASEVGYLFGVVLVLSSAAGGLLAPWVARTLERKGCYDGAIRAAGYAVIAGIGFCAAIPFTANYVQALVAVSGAVFFYSFPTGILPGTLQIGAPSRLRGVLASLYTIGGNSIGYGIGPTAIALVTDKIFGNAKMVGYSLGIVCCTAALVAAGLLLTALPHYRRLLDEAAS
ncbi:MFS transporter [Burkholderia multivorans]|uniref:MFS transporter n=1 Tax=Burkholderia multivorans TaxID=87883 RepID=UPI000CFF3D59|nr:MFS transporter [Burkholderia multivorans]AYZ01380.1 MFS transporter [Burkholderia multivorans]MBU9119548.1 MFS transporter [Burkholderia multivorans]PRG50393.1 MFS transporter [Burkholderia multivorans]